MRMLGVYLLVWVPSCLAVNMMSTTPPPIDLQVKVFNNSVNVRTVLFKETDVFRRCWSKHDINLLIARRIVQDLIPRKIPKDFQALLKYFNYLLEEVRAKFPPKNYQTMMLALYDALGGYLFSVVMPVLNEAYYAGNVDYKTVAELHNMLGVMMDYLGTNGNGWAPPCDMTHIATKVAPLPLKMGKIDSPCEAFVIPYLNQMKSHEDNEFNCEASALTESKIQIPFLDDNSYPSALAIPLKEHPLFSLMSECSVNIIPKFYIMAMRCLSGAPFTNKDVLAFNKNLHRWVISTVVPHLQETSRWYPGFGSIMRVVETMNQRGLASTEQLKPDISPPENTLEMPDSFCGQGNIGGGGFSVGPLPGWAWILIYVLLGLAVVLLICLVHCCIHVRIRQRAGRENCEEDEFVFNPILGIYCGLQKRRQQTMRESKRSSKDGKSSSRSKTSPSSPTSSSYSESEEE